MSFSGKVKEEIAEQIGGSMHCRAAELAAILSFCGNVAIDVYDRISLRVYSENKAVVKKCALLLHNMFDIPVEAAVRQGKNSRKARMYVMVVKPNDHTKRILQRVKMLDADGMPEEKLIPLNSTLIMRDCCKRAFLKGAFLAAGSVNDPNRFYHMEIVCDCQEKAELIAGLAACFQIHIRIVERKGHYVAYLKEAEMIVDFLNVIEGHLALMAFENVRILKDIKNHVNRQVNCETANMNKTITTAVRQTEDIRLIQEKIGLEALPEGLKEIAELRLENEEMPLKDLGQLLSPPLGKSGVNHRLKKISEIADSLRGEQGAGD